MKADRSLVESDGDHSLPPATGRDIEEGAVFVAPSQAAHRRVVALHEGRVFYSKGGDRLYNCLGRTFRRWLARHSARVAHTRMAAS